MKTLTVILFTSLYFAFMFEGQFDENQLRCEVGSGVCPRDSTRLKRRGSDVTRAEMATTVAG